MERNHLSSVKVYKVHLKISLYDYDLIEDYEKIYHLSEFMPYDRFYLSSVDVTANISGTFSKQQLKDVLIEQFGFSFGDQEGDFVI